MSRKSLLVLGARLAQLPAILAARAMGLRIIAVDPDPGAVGLGHADVAHSCDLANLSAILELARSERIDGALTLAADYPMPVLAQVWAQLGLAGPAIDIVERATNKHRMRRALAVAGVPCPEFRHVTSIEAAVNAAYELGCDTVFKPAMSHGGRGVSRVPAGSAPALMEAAYQRAAKETRADGILVEEFVDGPEFSIESLGYRGRTEIIAVTDKLTSGPPYFVELGHSQPSRFSDADQQLLRRCAIDALRALGIDNAAGHTEIRLSATGPVVMEAAARMGGGFICSHLVPLSTGIDLVTAVIRTALGEQPNLAPAHAGRPAAIRFLRTDPGTVIAVHGVERARTIEGVEDLAVYVQAGSRVPALVDATGRVGHAICTGRDLGEAIAHADAAAAAVLVETSQA